MDAKALLLVRYDEIHDGFVGDLLSDLNDEEIRSRPDGLNSVVWLIWHFTRCEDVVVNRLVGDRAQVFDDEGWADRLGIARRDVGVGMTSAEVDALSVAIDASALRSYRDAVSARTKAVIAALSADDLDVRADEATLRRALADDAALIDAGAWVADFWAANRSRGWLLLHCCLLHPYGHMYDALTVQGRLRAVSA